MLADGIGAALKKDFGTSRCGFLAMLHYLSLCAEGRHRGPQLALFAT